MVFDNIRLDEFIEQGARGGPRFKTTVIGFGTGTEQRNRKWQFARAQWDVGYGVQTQAQYQGIAEFFYARNGRLRGFRFKDWTDYIATKTNIGSGDGINTVFQLVKTYSDAVNTYIRKITRPIESTIQIFVNDVLQTVSVDYTVGALGVITFTVAPAGGAVVTASYEFDIPVRFDIDHLELDVIWQDAASLPDITILELRE